MVYGREDCSLILKRLRRVEMTRKNRWLALSCLIGAALVLSSCQSTAVEEGEDKTVIGEVIQPETPGGGTTTPAPGDGEGEVIVEKGFVWETPRTTSSGSVVTSSWDEEPQYGGEVVFPIEPGPNLNPAVASPVTSLGALTYQALRFEDITMGPQGTKERAFTVPYFPYDERVGALAESWEQPDLTTFVWHIRKGVHYHDKAPLWGREFTADDVVFSILYFQSEPRSFMYKPESTPEDELIKVTKLDEDTVEVKLPSPDAMLPTRITGQMLMIPREVAEAEGGFDDWRNAAGTGPFVVTDYIPDSAMTFERHPEYWEYDPFHPDNRLPYVDSAKALIFGDAGVQLAALRTGKIDRMYMIDFEQARELRRSNPELLWYQSRTFDCQLWLMNDRWPNTDIRVRRALHMAIDYEEMANDLFDGETVINDFPLKPGYGPDLYAPLEELPPETQELFGYDPDKARQLLAEAGYPDGKFELEVTDWYLDVASLVAEYFTDIGLDASIRLVDEGTFWDDAVNKKSTAEALVAGWNPSHPYSPFGSFYKADHVWNFALIPAEGTAYYEEQWAKASLALDAERNEIVKEMGIRAIGEAWSIPVPQPNQFNFWQPWLKGYAGEMYFGHIENGHGVYTNVWIDQDVKAALR